MRVFYVFNLFLIMLLIVSCNTSSFAEIRAFLPDISDKTNGVYRGHYSVSRTPVRVTLDVTVENNNIIEIRIIQHTSSKIGKRAEIITQGIIEEQSLEIDTISGATASSKAILKAVENALQ
ncbi:MAG: FMN-binding protein [Treponema sp.]|nr:FMN-binding protein [Treponema sp.]